MSKNMEDTLREVGAKIGSSIDDAKDKAQDAFSRAQDKKQDTIDQLKDKVQNVADQAREKGQDLRNKASDQKGKRFEDFAGVADNEFSCLYGSEGKMECLMNFIRNRPVATLVIALIAGTFLSRMFKCCCKHRKCK